ncbi:TPA: hypothetical protein ACJGX6_004955 [Salmonella enterica subsp. enterica serovar Paratyphi B]
MPASFLFRKYFAVAYNKIYTSTDFDVYISSLNTDVPWDISGTLYFSSYQISNVINLIFPNWSMLMKMVQMNKCSGNPPVVQGGEQGLHQQVFIRDVSLLHLKGEPA